MKFAIALASLILSVAKMASGSKYVDTHKDGDLDACLLRTYITDNCYGQERNGYIYSAQGCRGCGDIQGNWAAFSLQGDCPDGRVYLFTENACAGISTSVEFTNSGPNETCYPVDSPDEFLNMTFVSLQACFLAS